MSRGISGWIEQYSDFLSLAGHNKVLCVICKCTFKCSQRGQIHHHIRTQKHLCNIERFSETDASSLIETNEVFIQELCEVLVAANIPWVKLDKVIFRSFIEKYCKRPIPHESTLRRQLSSIYKKTVATISNEVEDQNIWLSVHEATDSTGRKVTNLMVGNLMVLPTMLKTWLVSSMISDTKKVDVLCSTVIKNSLRSVLPDVKPENVLFLVTDASYHMLKAGRLLKNDYPNMMHLTCLAHTLHQICEFVRKECPEVDRLINECKEIFLKAPSRINAYIEKHQRLPLLPTPVSKRCDIWIEDAIFYTENYETIEGIISTLDKTECVGRCKNLFKNPLLSQQLEFIKNNFGHIPQAIKMLERQYQPLTESLDIFNNAVDELNIDGDFGNKLEQYIGRLKNRNPDFFKINAIAKSISDNRASAFEQNFMYAPVTSTAVERSLTQYKDILSDKRRSFTPVNLEQYIVVLYNGRQTL